MKKTIVIVVTSHKQLGDSNDKTGYYLSEVSHSCAVFKTQGFEIDFVSPKGGKAPMDPSSYKLDDPINKSFIEDKTLASKLDNTLTPSDVDANQSVAIYYAGGHGTMWDFPDNDALANIAARIYENNGVVAAVCHGPSGLINIKLSNGDYLVKGKDVSCFTNEEEAAVGKTDVMPFLLESKLAERGANIKKKGNWQSCVSVSERLITGQNPQSATEVGHEIVKLLR